MGRHRAVRAVADADKARHAYHEQAAELEKNWPTRCGTIPGVWELRLLAQAAKLDHEHDYDEYGRCSSRRCRFRLRFRRHECGIRDLIRWSRRSSIEQLWLYMLNNVLGRPATIETVRAWLDECHHTKRAAYDNNNNDDDDRTAVHVIPEHRDYHNTLAAIATRDAHDNQTAEIPRMRADGTAAWVPAVR